jgi:hypothetical protein
MAKAKKIFEGTNSAGMPFTVTAKRGDWPLGYKSWRDDPIYPKVGDRVYYDRKKWVDFLAWEHDHPEKYPQAALPEGFYTVLEVKDFTKEGEAPIYDLQYELQRGVWIDQRWCMKEEFCPQKEN